MLVTLISDLVDSLFADWIPFYSIQTVLLQSSILVRDNVRGQYVITELN